MVVGPAAATFPKPLFAQRSALSAQHTATCNSARTRFYRCARAPLRAAAGEPSVIALGPGGFAASCGCAASRALWGVAGGSSLLSARAVRGLLATDLLHWARLTPRGFPSGPSSKTPQAFTLEATVPKFGGGWRTSDRGSGSSTFDPQTWRNVIWPRDRKWCAFQRELSRLGQLPAWQTPGEF
jgi:hypothetical protein